MLKTSIYNCFCRPLLLGCVFLAPECRAQDATVPAVSRAVTIADSAQMTRWSDWGYFLGGAPSGPVALLSPDKTKFIIVIKKGNLEQNTVEYSLLLFDADEVFDSPRPQRLLTMSSSSNRPGISELKWLDDNRTVAFLGENPNETPQIYTFDTETKRITERTHHATPVVSYDMTRDGAVTVYEAVAEQIVSTEEIRRRGVVITTQQPDELLYCPHNSDWRTEKPGRDLFLQIRGQQAVRIPSSDFITEHQPLVLSPTGKYALLAVNVSTIPEYWKEYKEPLVHSFITERRKPGAWSRVTQYMLLDTTRRSLTPLLDAPISWVNQGFIWAEDSESVVVSSTYLPLEGTEPVERETRRQTTFVAEIALPDKQIVKIDGRNLNVLQWNQTTGKLILGSGDWRNKSAVAAYEKVGTAWKSASVQDEDIKDTERIKISLEEDLNHPPKIVAHNSQSEKQSLLLDLNPQFSSLRFGKVESVTWKATDGHEVEGGLYLPPDYVSTERYPLVIQTHGFRKDRFWIDGPWSSAFAAQALAARGIVVLQVGGSIDHSEDTKYANTADEAPHQMAAYEGAIDYLDSRRLIDRKRVGIVGFSRTVYYAEYALTHSKYPFVAALLADGFDGGYVNYLLWPVIDYVGVNGGEPFGPGFATWWKNSPGFNLDKITSAVKVEYYGAGDFLAGWQLFSGMSLLGKPVDFLWLPNGYHMLIKPWEQLASQQGTVDWFSFWLRNEQDRSPEKRQQYERWEGLRALFDQQRSGMKAGPNN